MDFTKAFDYINRAAMYYKLIKRGVDGKMLNLIKNMYNKATTIVKWKGKVGENTIDSNFGVLQGGMLSPKLFTEFLSNIKEHLNKTCGIVVNDELVSYMLYADDMALMSDSADGLQQLLDNLYQYCNKWHLIVSLAKTNIMIFTKKRTTETFKFGSEEIQYVEEYKYLGNIISNKKNIFSMNTTYLTDKAHKAMFSLSSYISSVVGHLQPELALKMFDAQISPILEYGSEIWYNNKPEDSKEKLHLAFFKNILKVKTSTSTVAVYSELGRFPLQLKHKTRMLNYWNRILTLEEGHIIKQAYNSLLQLHDWGQTNWCTHVRDNLIEVGLIASWHNQTLDTRAFNNYREKIHSNYMNHIMTLIQDYTSNPKLRTYKLFKNDFKRENYFNDIQNEQYRIALTRFRLSAHNLAIETGRYTKPKTPINNRTCLYCKNHLIENEIHFLLECPMYDAERQILLTSVSPFLPGIDNTTNETKFVTIMSSKIFNVMHALGKFLFDSLKKRNSAINVPLD